MVDTFRNFFAPRKEAPARILMGGLHGLGMIQLAIQVVSAFDMSRIPVYSRSRRRNWPSGGCAPVSALYPYQGDFFEPHQGFPWTQRNRGAESVERSTFAGETFVMIRSAGEMFTRWARILHDGGRIRSSNYGRGIFNTQLPEGGGAVIAEEETDTDA